MIGLNGGLVGPRRSTSRLIATGIYTNNERALTERTDPFWNDVALLLHMNGTDGSTTITDSSRFGIPLTNSGAAISTAQSKFGGASCRFDSLNDRVTVNSGYSLALGKTDFTIEFWYYAVSAGPAGFGTYFDTRIAGDAAANNIVIYHNSGTQLTCLLNNTAVNTTNALLSTWHHLAIARQGTVTRCFLDGAQFGSISNDTTVYAASNQRPIIGNNLNSDVNANAYIDELRITRACRYAADFTPPTAPFPDA